jgi:hypothetical protein
VTRFYYRSGSGSFGVVAHIPETLIGLGVLLFVIVLGLDACGVGS